MECYGNGRAGLMWIIKLRVVFQNVFVEAPLQGKERAWADNIGVLQSVVIVASIEFGFQVLNRVEPFS